MPGHEAAMVLTLHFFADGEAHSKVRSNVRSPGAPVAGARPQRGLALNNYSAVLPKTFLKIGADCILKHNF